MKRNSGKPTSDGRSPATSLPAVPALYSSGISRWKSLKVASSHGRAPSMEISVSRSSCSTNRKWRRCQQSLKPLKSSESTSFWLPTVEKSWKLLRSCSPVPATCWRKFLRRFRSSSTSVPCPACHRQDSSRTSARTSSTTSAWCRFTSTTSSSGWTSWSNSWGVHRSVTSSAIISSCWWKPNQPASWTSRWTL